MEFSVIHMAHFFCDGMGLTPYREYSQWSLNPSNRARNRFYYHLFLSEKAFFHRAVLFDLNIRIL